MPYHLNITIDGTGISDDDAKIISLSIMGLSYRQISAVTFINNRCLHNKVSNLYGMFRTEKTIVALMVLGLLNGFNHYGYVNGTDVLTPDERKKLGRLNLRLLREPKRLVLLWQAA